MGSAGPQPRAPNVSGPPTKFPDVSGHCQTSTTSARCQWSLPDINRELQMSVGPLPNFQMSVGTARLQPTTSARCQWSLPDINGEHKMSDRMPQRVPWMCQVECQNMHQMECQIECQNIYIYIIYIYMVVDLKVLVRSFNCESRACYVGNPRESFFSSSRK